MVESKTLSEIKPEIILETICRKDEVMKGLVEKTGEIELKPVADSFDSLVQSIIYQQISGSAANSIYRKLLGEIGSRVTPEKLNTITDDQLRRSGISPQKIRYLRDLTEKVISRELDLSVIHELSDDEIVQKLTAVKGIGVWTAQMFLIFTLGRPDVFPSGDLGIQNAMKKHYGVKGKTIEKRMTKIAGKWSPYRTAATLILWKSENTKLPSTDDRRTK